MLVGVQIWFVRSSWQRGVRATQEYEERFLKACLTFFLTKVEEKQAVLAEYPELLAEESAVLWERMLYLPAFLLHETTPFSAYHDYALIDRCRRIGVSPALQIEQQLRVGTRALHGSHTKESLKRVLKDNPILRSEEAISYLRGFANWLSSAFCSDPQAEPAIDFGGSTRNYGDFAGTSSTEGAFGQDRSGLSELPEDTECVRHILAGNRRTDAAIMAARVLEIIDYLEASVRTDSRCPDPSQDPDESVCTSLVHSLLDQLETRGRTVDEALSFVLEHAQSRIEEAYVLELKRTWRRLRSSWTGANEGETLEHRHAFLATAAGRLEVWDVYVSAQQVMSGSARERGDIDGAIHHLSLAIGTERKLANNRPLGHLLLQMAELQSRRGEIQTAISTADDALTAFQEAGDFDGQWTASCNLAAFLSRRSVGQSIGYLQHALRLAVLQGSNSKVAATRVRLAGAYNTCGNYQQAANEAHAALEAPEEDVPLDCRVGALALLGFALWNVGNRRTASDHFRTALAVCDGQSDQFLQQLGLKVHLEFLDLRVSTEEPSRILKDASLLSPRVSNCEDPIVQATFHFILGKAHLRMKTPVLASHFFEQARDLLPDGYLHQGVALALCGTAKQLSAVEVAGHDGPAQAREFWQESRRPLELAADVFTRCHATDQLRRALKRLGAAFVQCGELDEARRAYGRAIAYWEWQRGTVDDPLHREFFQERDADLFDEAVRVNLDLFDRDKTASTLSSDLFAAAEGRKCRVLLDSLVGATSTSAGATHPDPAEDGSPLEQPERVMDRKSVDDKPNAPASLKALQTQLPQETAVLHYSILPDANEVALLAVFPDHSEMVQLYHISLEQIWQAFLSFQSSIGGLNRSLHGVPFVLDPMENDSSPFLRDTVRRFHPELVSSLHNMGQALLPDSLIEHLSDKAIERPVVVPEGFLFGVPFSALRISVCGDLQYVIESGDHHKGFEVVHVPSVSILLRCQETRFARRLRPEDAFCLFVSDPNTDSPELALPGITDSVEQTRSKWFSPTRSFHLHSSAANREAVLPGIGLSDIVMFFGHGDYSYADPLASCIHLHASNGRSDQLTAADLLDKAARDGPGKCLVFFQAACWTGWISVDAKARSREVLGFPTALLHVGASSVVSPLWPTRSTPTCRLADNLLEQLTSGKTVSGSLRKAQLDLAQSANWNCPYFWAPYYVFGDFDIWR